MGKRGRESNEAYLQAATLVRCRPWLLHRSPRAQPVTLPPSADTPERWQGRRARSLGGGWQARHDEQARRRGAIASLHPRASTSTTAPSSRAGVRAKTRTLAADLAAAGSRRTSLSCRALVPPFAPSCPPPSLLPPSSRSGTAAYHRGHDFGDRPHIMRRMFRRDAACAARFLAVGARAARA